MIRMLAIIAVLIGSASVAEAEDWTGELRCGQHRFRSDSAGLPLDWRLPFQVANNRIRATRSYIGEAAGILVATFTGIMQSDGTVEIGVVSTEEQGQAETFHARLIGRLVADRVSLTGDMRTPRGTMIRSCRLDLSHS